MADRNTIPLFPLQTVVFPGQAVPLHIFEPRYKQMFADVRAAGQMGEVLPVGIVLGQDRELQAEMGCTVVLESVLNEYEDGRLDIITLGERRFRIEQVTEEKPYLEAWVEYIDDDEVPIDPTLLAQALAGCERLAELIGEGSGMEAGVGDLQTAFQIAQLLALELEAKQRLLEMATENMRLEMICTHLAQLIPMLEKRNQLRRRIHSNGHTKES